MRWAGRAFCSKTEETQSQKTAQKRGADPPSPARCVGLTLTDGNETPHRSRPQAKRPFFKAFSPQKRPCQPASPEKDTDRPCNPHGEKERYFAAPNFGKTTPTKTGLCNKTLSAENRDRLNPEGLQSDRTGANPCPPLMANEF